MDRTPTDDQDRTPATAGGSTVVVEDGAAAAIVGRLRAELTVAMRARDKVRVSALRTALAAIANAEAPPVGEATSPADQPAVGRLVEHRRLVLAGADVERILRHEIADRIDTAEQCDTHGRGDEAEVVRAEIAVLAEFLD